MLIPIDAIVNEKKIVCLCVEMIGKRKQQTPEDCNKYVNCPDQLAFIWYSKICLKRSLKRTQKIGFHDRLSLNAGQKYCRMLQGELLQNF